jgi:hypothetical protein
MWDRLQPVITRGVVIDERAVDRFVPFANIIWLTTRKPVHAVCPSASFVELTGHRFSHQPAAVHTYAKLLHGVGDGSSGQLHCM